MDNLEEILEKVKKSLGITGGYLDDKIKEDMEEVLAYLKSAGVKKEAVTPGILARGISDLWNQNELSDYFLQRTIQMKYLQKEDKEENHE